MNYFSKTLTTNDSVSQSSFVKNQFRVTLTGTWTGVVSLQISRNDSEWNGYNNFAANTTQVFDAGDTGFYYRFKIANVSSFTGSVVVEISNISEEVAFENSQWKIVVQDDELLFQKKESGSWVTKEIVSA